MKGQNNKRETKWIRHNCGDGITTVSLSPVSSYTQEAAQQECAEHRHDD